MMETYIVPIAPLEGGAVTGEVLMAGRVEESSSSLSTNVSGLLSCLWRVCYQRGLPRLVFTSW